MSVDDLRRQPAEERDLFYRAQRHHHYDDDDRDPGFELDLALSLGGHARCRKSDARDAGSWENRCRILTAGDFPTPPTTHQPASPSSECSSLSSLATARSGVGTKRHADDQPARIPEARSDSPGPGQVLVGWPPIRAYRINNLAVNHPPKDNSTKQRPTAPCANTPADQPGDSQLGCPSKGAASTQENNSAASAKEPEKNKTPTSHLVKVNMDGMPIGRKVDLTAHNSYTTLAWALEDMFHKTSTTTNPSPETTKTSKLLDGSSDFLLTYADKDGDWMLVGDVPWGMFLNSARRLRIMRRCDANVFGVQPNTNGS